MLNLIPSSGGGLIARLKQILGRAQDLSPLAPAIQKVLFEANRRRALRGLDFQGRPLAPLAQSTLRDRARHGFPPGPPLVRRGESSNLIAGCVIAVSPNRSGNGKLSLSKSWPGAPWMQFHALGGSRLPRRDVMGFGQDELEQVRAMLPKHVLGR